MRRSYYVYIATNKTNTVLYTGITNHLERRMYEHRQKLTPGFAARYNVCRLVYYEIFPTPAEAIAAEKKIKGWTRKKKASIIRSMNPELRDLLAGDSSLRSE